MSRLTAVQQGVAGDVRDVVVGQRVHRLLASPRTRHEAGVAQHAKVLGHERLRRPEVLDELVHATRSSIELEHDRESVRRPERAQQLCGSAHPDVVTHQIKILALTHASLGSFGCALEEPKIAARGSP
jgi:hypothetical protein